jgi:hypothetical protein
MSELPHGPPVRVAIPCFGSSGRKGWALIKRVGKRRYMEVRM